jgi:ABC-type transport system involved in multi-copper enzyme maturation permease subunit
MSLRLVNAEFLKLRKRRGLVISALALTVLPMLIAYTVLVGLHASDPVKNGPAGGMQNFAGSMEILVLLSVVAGILVGTTLGTGDLGAGVFRELVVTGRSRLALFAARLPAGLALLVPIVGGAFAIAATASVVLAGSQESHAPSAGLLLESAGWLGLWTVVSMVLGLGVSSLVSSRGTSIGVLLAWWLVAMPLLAAIGSLGALREALIIPAVDRLGPAALAPDSMVPMSVTAAVAAVAAWLVVPLVVGAWRTATRDA